MKLAILFGSQTGTAEDVAKRISWESKRRNICVRVSALDDYPFADLINEELVLFICSTMGQGEEPDNMKKFWKFLLRRSLPTNSLKLVSYSVIGLGDSSYSKFNFVAKKLFKRLKQLGAYPISDLVLGDDQHELGPDAEIDPWLISFWENVTSRFNIENIPISEDLLPPLFNVESINTIDPKFIFKPNDSLNSALVLKNSRITAENHFQDVRHLILDIKSTKLSFNTGDVCVVLPRNSNENVRDFLSLLGLNASQTIRISKNDPDCCLPQCFNNLCTVKDVVESYWDIQSVPRRSFFELLWHFSQSEVEREKLQEFSSAKGQEELYTYCNRPRRSIIEVLYDFPDTTPYIPLAYLFDLIPPIKPRLFTIASSPLFYPNELHMLVAVVNYTTRLRKPREGLCSTFLSNMTVGESLDIGVRKGTFVWPSDKTPALMIGPGTGCSPFRAFTQDRCARGTKGCYLFFGCRNEDSDFLCKDDWKDFESKGVLQFFVAFSRDQEHKVYVQHKIAEKRDLVWKLINEENACIMIAGNAKQMPQGVQDAICDVLQSCGGLDENGAKSYLNNLEKNGRLQFEVWA